MTHDSQFSEYFRRYATASLEPEPEKLAEFYNQSFLAAGPRGGAAFQNDAAFLDWLRKLHDFNAGSGMTSMTPEVVDEIPVGAGYTMVTIQWAATFQKTGDSPIQFSISYLLRESDSGHKVVAYISHEDQEEAMRAHGLL